MESHTIPNGRRRRGRQFVYGAPGVVFIRAAPGDAELGSTEFFDGNWVRVGPDGQTERLPADPLPDREGAYYTMVGRGGPYRPFTTETLNTLGPDGPLYWVRNDEYVVHRVQSSLQKRCP